MKIVAGDRSPAALLRSRWILPAYGEPLELLRLAHDAFSRGDKAAVLDLTDPDVEWGTSGQFPGIDTLYRGHEGVARWMDDLREAWETFQVGVDDVIFDAGEHCGVVERIHGRGRTSGVDVELRFCSGYELRDGKFVRRTVYADRDALASAAP